MSPIDLRRAACSVATSIAVRWTELKAADTWPISSREVTGTGSTTTSRSRGSLACCNCSTRPGSWWSATSLAVSVRVRSGWTMERAISSTRPTVNHKRTVKMTV